MTGNGEETQFWKGQFPQTASLEDLDGIGIGHAQARGALSVIERLIALAGPWPDNWRTIDREDDPPARMARGGVVGQPHHISRCKGYGIELKGSDMGPINAAVLGADQRAISRLRRNGDSSAGRDCMSGEREIISIEFEQVP